MTSVLSRFACPSERNWTRANSQFPAATLRRTVACAILAALAAPAFSAGTLKPTDPSLEAIRIIDHDVKVTINNGFARTEVLQAFFNPNDIELEAVYTFPVPKNGALSEMTIINGEREIHGEVLPKDEAEAIHKEEKEKGNDSGLAKKNSYNTYEFRVSPVLPNTEVKLRFVYYQPIEIDTGIGRYVYPIEEGGTDEAAAAFWGVNEEVDNRFSIGVDLKLAVPIAELRTPGFEEWATIQESKEAPVSVMEFSRVLELHPDELRDEPGLSTYKLHVEQQQAKLDRDFVLYYRLADNLPGRVELVAFRDDPGQPGTFMLVVTPGVDLQPLSGGADFCFVLDTSGSMKGKLVTLANGVAQALGVLKPEDRFRVIDFAAGARDLLNGWKPATAENVQAAIDRVRTLEPGGGTNIYAALELALDPLDADRATSIVLVTDGVTNAGSVDPREFRKLIEQYDIRFFGFLMGNSSNWPLMRLIAEASGGFYAAVSNNDDIIGQITLAKSKVTTECLHDVDVRFSGTAVRDVTGEFVRKVYRGQQLVLFGRYDQGGSVELTLDASLTGENQTYRTNFTLPEMDAENPEIERLWAMATIESIEMKRMFGEVQSVEAQQAIEKLGVDYQLVTDETSMVVLTDAAFEERGVERRNQARTARERAAQTRRAAQPVRSSRVDEQQPMFNRPAANPGNGGGAVDPVMAAVMLLGVIGVWQAARNPNLKRDRAGIGRTISETRD